MSWTEQDLVAYLNRRKAPGGRVIPTPLRGSTVPKESYSRRGMDFEDRVNAANEAYRLAGVALVHKVPTPARIIRRDGQPVLIQEASTVDYLGAWQGKSIAVEAKSTNEARWPLSLIKDHQVQFLLEHEKIGRGISGVLFHFGRHGRTFWLPVRELLAFSERKVRGGRKSISILELGPPWEVPSTARAEVDYLVTIEAWLKGGVNP